MNNALWIVQILLALMFTATGLVKLTQPREKMLRHVRWVAGFPTASIRLIGFLELLAVIGLILPSLTHIMVWLTPLAAVGLVLTMIGAAIVHMRYAEYPNIIPNVVLLILAAFVAYERFGPTPF